TSPKLAGLLTIVLACVHTLITGDGSTRGGLLPMSLHEPQPAELPRFAPDAGCGRLRQLHSQGLLSMPRMTGGDAIVDGLIRHGIDTMFGLPGVQTYGLFDALARNANRIRLINARHEQ